MSILDTMGFDPSDDSEVQRILQEYKGKTNRFVREHPFSSPAELKAIVLAPSGVEALGAERGMPILRVIVNQEFYPLMKRIYDTAGNDSRVNKDAGREINRQEGFDAMQVSYSYIEWRDQLICPPPSWTWY